VRALGQPPRRGTGRSDTALGTRSTKTTSRCSEGPLRVADRATGAVVEVDVDRVDVEPVAGVLVSVVRDPDRDRLEAPS